MKFSPLGIFPLIMLSGFAETLQLDFNSGSSATQSGWESITAGGGTWSRTVNGITVDADATGSATLDDRVRTNNEGGAESDMWADFLFANDTSSSGGGIDFDISGLQINTEYPITIWSYDRASTGTRTSDWSANDSGGSFLAKGSNSFNGSNGQPQNLNDYALTFNITTSGTGTITLRGVLSEINPSASHNVFVNGLRIGDPVAVNADSDDDDLFDQWEIFYFNNITTATGAGNNDADSLTNLEEQTLGTSPILADTDNDNLDDDEEATYNTNPIIADTDGDDILDGNEVNGSTGFTTDPTKPDTDEDGFTDLTEITAGTNPTDGTDFPNGLPLQITEFLANNFNGLEDGFGNNEDWIEIHNPNGVDISLSSYTLTDDAALPAQWSFPPITIPANSYLIVFASGENLTEDPAGNPHTNFKLSNDGEYLGLYKGVGTILEDEYAPTFPAQFVDISYGPSNGTQRFFGTPTPGIANNAGFTEVVLDTSFSIDRGLKTAPFSLAITTLTPGASIRYTTDGSKPSPSSGILYNGPISISSTTTVRAIAYKTNALSTNVDTHTYIFASQVADQPSNPSGWPSNWITAQFPSRPADYEMDSRVKNGTVTGYSIEDALTDIPSLSIVLPQSDFTGSSGIYMNPTTRGINWEKECSLELIYPDGSDGFQENCQVEIHGNSSRNPSRMQKHSMRITFKKEFGVGRLDFPLIEGSDIDKFNKLVLRACFTDSWGLASWAPTRYRPNDSQYLRDVWMKEAFRDMGQPSSSGTFMHLYVNGIYWGLYNPTERIEADMLAENYGGKEEDWEVNEDLTGKDARYLQMENLANNSLAVQSNYDAIQPYIDVENFADYVFLHSYGDSEDWPAKNGYAAANINPATGDLKYRFFVWDQEIALDKFSWRRYNSTANVGNLFQKFRVSPEFRLLFADRVAKHMLNNGALTLENAQSRYLALANRIDKAIVAESARWGDTSAKTPYGNNVEQPSPLNDRDDDAYPPVQNGSPLSQIYFTRENSWLPEQDNILNHHMPIIHSNTNSNGIIPKLRAANLYPSIDPPVFSQHGGSIGSGISMVMSGTGTIYYTTDGSDPRNVGGSINSEATAYSSAIAIASSQTVKARSRNGSEWSALTEATFSGNDLVISEFMYHAIDPTGDAEFIEILNTGNDAIQLEGYIIDTAIDPFTFPAHELAPDNRILIVKDQVAFESIYGTSLNTFIVGNFSGSLKNSTETIRFTTPDGTVIQQFTYYDGQIRPGIPNWPAPADGGGFSLTLNQPLTNPDHNLASSWRISRLSTGSPGFADDITFAQWATSNGNAGATPNGDADEDGTSNFHEFAFATNPNSGSDTPGTTAQLTGSNFTFSFRRQIASSQITYLVEYSDDLLTWDDAGIAFLSTTPSTDGTTVETWQIPTGPSGASRMFARARAIFNP